MRRSRRFLGLVKYLMIDLGGTKELMRILGVRQSFLWSSLSRGAIEVVFCDRLIEEIVKLGGDRELFSVELENSINEVKLRVEGNSKEKWDLAYNFSEKIAGMDDNKVKELRQVINAV
jgi:hypothetical protein